LAAQLWQQMLISYFENSYWQLTVISPQTSLIFLSLLIITVTF